MTTRFRLASLLEKAEPPMSQAELARRAKVSPTTINRMCANHTNGVDLITLDRIASVLGIEPGELLEREGKKRRR